ncbi:MAG: hypothetical protein GOP50_04330 [Candidatus Heimdallarchaeota archaeon]|nr:hypothetical protein [Candidatus Heimdallarchaeota archaeon]
MNKEQTNPEITKKIEENTEKLIKEIVADQKKSINEIKKETATKMDGVKAKLVETAKTRADSDFMKEKAKHELDLKLQITKYRDELVENFIVKAQKKIATVIGSAEYEKSLENLAVEAVITLKQPEIVVLCREEDKKIFTSQFFDKISKQLKEHNLDTKLSLAKDHIKSMGGIKIVTTDRKISIDNTYEKRIERSLRNLKRELSLLLKEEG